MASSSSKDLTGSAKTFADVKKQNSMPHFMLRSNSFSFRRFPAREMSKLFKAVPCLGRSL
jgi:hypothetical protein